MKKSIQLFLAITVFFSVISCKNSTEKKSKIPPKQPQQTEEHQHTNSEELQLNDGELWKANKETTKGIHAMLQIMSNFTEKDNPEAYAQLKKSLETEFSTIITKCTMTGEAHNQLHIFLVPMKDLFDGLTAEPIKINKESFEKLHTHLTEYKNYFE